jgi:alginate O-acetyltransferase complex protein AlgI
MLFNTVDFLVFFTTFFVVYWFVLGKNLGLQNIFILVASYVFYGWWSWPMLSLIFLTSLSSYLAAKYIESKPAFKKYILIWTLILNFGILIYFKYAGFFLDGLTVVADTIGIDIGYTFGHILLPVGISFYTFQALSYVIDVYRGQLKASQNFVECAAFISFFPQLVAGPIERAPNLLKQIQQKRNFNLEDAKEGLRYILWGLFKKMMVADNCAGEVERIFAHHQEMNSPMLWWGITLFSVQIYCDFSGYSEIAIGCGKLLGVQFMQNFNFPYFATHIKAFWKRWHISLTTWFKDYVFIPLGGNRGSIMVTYKNVLIVFLLSGLWHGANYTFVVWGAYHALLYIGYVWLIEGQKWALPSWLSMFLTFILVLIGWVFFRSADMGAALQYLEGMFDWRFSTELNAHGHTYERFSVDAKIILGMTVMLGVEYLNKSKKFGLDIGHWDSMNFRWAVYIVLLLIVLTYGSFNEQTFIYFNF